MFSASKVAKVFLFCFAFQAFISPIYAQIETQVDHVAFGYLHWNQASGDTESDDGDIDNSFGDHNGEGNFVKVEEVRFAIAASNNGYIQWDFVVPSDGVYKLTLSIIKGHDRTARFLLWRDNNWLEIDHFVSADSWHEETPAYELVLNAGVNRFKIEATSSWFYAYWVRLSKLEEVQDYTPVHPILHFKTSDLPLLRSKTVSGPMKLVWDQLNQNLDNYFNPQHHYYIDLNNSDWQRFIGGETHRDREKKLEDLMMGYLLTEDTKYLDLAIKIIEKALEWEDWYDSQWLARAEFTSVMAEAYDWLYPELSQRGILPLLRDCITREAEALYKYSMEEEGWASTHYLANWKAVCHGGLGLAGLALRGEVPESDQWIQRSKEKLLEYMANWFDQDGASMESYDYYYTYPMSYIVNFFSALKRVTGEDLFRAMDNVIQKSIPYSIALLRPQRDGHNTFDDVSLIVTKPHIMARLASVFQDGLAQWHFQYVTGEHKTTEVGWYNAHMTHQIFWYDDTVPIEYPNQSDRMSNAMLFPGFGRFTMRTGFEDTEDIQLSMECGHFGGGHGHPDQGGFELNAFGECLIEDPAPPVQYGSPLHQYLSSPEAHNVILIDGKGQMTAEGDPYDVVGSIDAFLHTDFIDYALANSKIAYDKGDNPVQKADRHVLFMRPDYFIIIDDVKKDDAPYQYEFVIHPDQDHKIKSISNDSFLFDGNTDLHVQFIEPQSFQYTVENQAALGYDAEYLRLSPHEEKVNGFFFTLLYPLRSDMTMVPVQSIQEENLSGIEVDDRNLVLWSKQNGLNFYQGLSSDALIFSRTLSKAGELDHIFLTMGSHLSINDAILIESDQLIKTAAVRFDADLLHIQGKIQVDQPATVRVNPLGMKLQSLKINNEIYPIDIENGLILLEVSGEVQFDMTGVTPELDDIPPNPPLSLVSPMQSDSTITLQWTPPQPSDDGDIASFYRIYRDDVIIDATVHTTYSDSGLVQDTEYSYAIYSVDDGGNQCSTPAVGTFRTTESFIPDISMIDEELYAYLTKGTMYYTKIERRMPLVLNTSKPVIRVPTPLLFDEYDGSTTSIMIDGKIPGQIFSGTLIVGSSVSEGPGRFRLLENSLVNLEGAVGLSMIVYGDSMRIDKTPPDPPGWLDIKK